MSYYYVDPNQQSVGPISLENLAALRRAGQISDDTPVIEEGAAEWLACRDFVAPLVPAWTPPAPPAPKRALGDDRARVSPATQASRDSRNILRFAAIAAAALVLLGVFLLGKLFSLGHAQAPTTHAPFGPTSNRPSAALSAPASKVPQAGDSWHSVLYQGKKADYRLAVPSFLREIQPSADSGADRTFVGPGGLTLSAQVVADTNQFWDHLTTARGLRDEKAGKPQTFQSRSKGPVTTQSFELTADLVGGQRLLQAVIFVRQDLTYALTTSVPDSWPGQAKPAALWITGFVTGITCSLEKGTEGAIANLAREIPCAQTPDLFKDLQFAESRLGHGPATESVQRELLTRAQWKNKLVENFGWFAGTPVNSPAARFVQIMGQPERTQTLGEQTFWYYRCSDGTIQLVMSALNLQTGGLVQAEVNDY